MLVEVALAAGSGETVAVLGPNGAGKSTVLRVLAGLLPLEAGRIAVDLEHGVPTVWDDPAEHRYVAPERRSVGMVFQEYALFPAMSALENAAFGLRARGMKRPEARRRAQALLDGVGVGDLADRLPSQLSGGQAQRVALARALAPQPTLLLLDEPLAALDVASRALVRRDLRATLNGFGGTTVIVTHDPVDAYALADRVLVLEQGRVAQAGTLASVTAHPRSRYVAELVGLNLLRGQLEQSVLALEGGGFVVVADSSVSGAAFATVRPQSVSLHAHQPDGSPRNTWLLAVADIDRRADRVRVQLAGEVPLVAEVTPSALDDLGLAVGDRVWAAVKATEVTVYPA